MRHLIACLSTSGLVVLERELRRIAPTLFAPWLVAIRAEIWRRYVSEELRAERVNARGSDVVS